MHGIIGAPCRTDQTGAIARVYVYIDTLECFARTRFSIELKNALRAATGRKVWDERTRDGFGWKLFVNGPTVNAFRILEQHWRDRDSICALHIALEFDAIEGVTRKQVIELIDYHFHIKYSRASDRSIVIGETTYSVDTALRRQRGQRRASKIGVAYHDRPGKLDGELDKPRYEIRLEVGRAITAQGFHTPIDLARLRPREFLAKVLTIKNHRPMLETIIRRSIKAFRPHPMMQTETRIRAKVRRDQTDTLTGFARVFPRQFERIKTWVCLDVVDDLQFTPMVRDGKHVVDEVGEMCNVSQAPSPRLHRERLVVRERL